VIVDLLLVDVEVGEHVVDVAVTDGRVVAVGSGLEVEPAEVVDGCGGALIPGLHDHHIHLLATAAARSSVDLVALGVSSDAQLRDVLHIASSRLEPGAWLRVVGYYEAIAGELTAGLIDSMVSDRPVRVQHRTGVMWVLNSAALRDLAPVLDRAPHGVERDEHLAPTGRCMRVDGWLREVVPSTTPDVASIAAELRAFGVTGVTDATPNLHVAQIAALAPAAMMLRVVACTAPGLMAPDVPPGLQLGPVKLLFDDHDAGDLDALVFAVRDAHAHGRTVAVHAVTRAGLAIAVGVFHEAGARPGDRIEHGAVVPPDLRSIVRDLGLQVVTQPAFVACRGDDYLRDVEPDDVLWLWPCGSLLDAGIGVAAGSDAPYGPLDPWQAIRAATERRTASGRKLGPSEAISARRALELYFGSANDPAGPARVVAPGVPADLCLLHLPLTEALRAPSADVVRATWFWRRGAAPTGPDPR
jgi:predicted amidohydrolase YtcJ